ncbi:hypothetical protein A9Q94_06070 [Rhodobacterales bacterium 56_14_T64]|nr:hypothetical protein A9Q94_06070 [Rhodobacterales bacterium 56_14_T64]
MTLHFRSYLTLFLVLAVTLTAHSAGALQGMRDATGQIVICSGSGPLVIYVDSDGQPARAPHDCPDCITLGMDALAPSQRPQHVAPEPLCRVDHPVQIRVHSRMPLRASARSPPIGL